MSLTFLEEQLKPETAKNTAKAFANIFYSKQNEETFTLERHNLIRLLKTWGTSNSDKHIGINVDVCSIFLKHLNGETKEVEEILREFEKNVNKTNTVCRKSRSVVLSEYYKRKKLRQKRKQFIETFDQEKLGCFAVKTIAEFNDNFDERIEDKDNDDDVIVDENYCSTLLLDKNERKQQILLGYSILNLNKTEECCSLLKTILARIAKEDSLLTVEKEFVCYLWENLAKIPGDLVNQLINGFGFLYEIPILKACCSVLKTGKIEINEDLKRISKLHILSDRIASIFCDLFLLSGRNEKIIFLYESIFA